MFRFLEYILTMMLNSLLSLFGLKTLTEAPEISDLRIVLVGKTGAGKSSTGNTILATEAFKMDSLSESVTRDCQKGNAVVGGRNVMVVDTPGVYDTSLLPEETRREIDKCIEMSVPGPHAFLLVVRLGVRFTEEERNAVKWIQENFGEEADRYTVVVFSHVDHLQGRTVEDALRSSKDLERLVHQCGGRYVKINNNLDNPAQVLGLIRKIEDMVKNRTDKYYTNEMYEAAQRRIKERERQQEERREQRRKQWKFVGTATTLACCLLSPKVTVGMALLGLCCEIYDEWRDGRERNADSTSQPETRIGNESED